MYDYRQSLERSKRSRAGTIAPRSFVLNGAEWVVHPGVFSPADTRSTAAHLSLLDFPVGGSFLEIGCGTGVIAVTAALAGCSRVVATDISVAATVNAEANAAAFEVEDVVEVRHGDMFDALDDASRFDMIYWHSNNAWAPPDLVVDIHELAYVDPGYRAHEQFFSGAHNYLLPGGRIMIGISSRAERGDLYRLADNFGLNLQEIASTTMQEPEGPISYELLEAVESR